MLRKLCLPLIFVLSTSACSVNSEVVRWDYSSNTTGPTRSGWSNNISPAKHAFSFSDDIVRYGKFSERFEARDGDCGGSDCTAPRYRSEIMLRNNLASPNTPVWYGWSFYNETIPSFNEDVNPYINIGQWKYGQSDKVSPPIKLLIKPDGYVYVQLDDMRRTYGNIDLYSNTCKLWHIEQHKGKWVDIVINTNWGTDKNGFLNVWINDEQKCNYKGQILANWSNSYPKKGNGWGKHLTHRHGIFVASTKNWRKKNSYPFPTFVVYYDEFRQGYSRKDVDIRYIEKNNLKAID